MKWIKLPSGRMLNLELIASLDGEWAYTANEAIHLTAADATAALSALVEPGEGREDTWLVPATPDGRFPVEPITGDGPFIRVKLANPCVPARDGEPKAIEPKAEVATDPDVVLADCKAKLKEQAEEIERLKDAAMRQWERACTAESNRDAAVQRAEEERNRRLAEQLSALKPTADGVERAAKVAEDYIPAAFVRPVVVLKILEAHGPWQAKPAPAKATCVCGNLELIGSHNADRCCVFSEAAAVCGEDCNADSALTRAEDNGATGPQMVDDAERSVTRSSPARLIEIYASDARGSRKAREAAKAMLAALDKK